MLWGVQVLLLSVHLRHLRTIAHLDLPDPAAWPAVSALVPARDEAGSVAEALSSRLADDYPALEVIAVDDRSTDATAERIAEVAARDPRVVPLRIDTLPVGWLGKVHALARGVELARGEWLLVSDADVHLAPGGLKRAIAYCEAEELDFLALVPEFRSTSFIVDVLWTVFMRVLATFVDPAAVRSPRSRVVMGSGAFMLVRREVFDRTPGFEHLRLETTDDIALAMMMKQAGARCDFANGRGVASVSIYGGLGEFFRGVEKNAGSLVRAPFAAVVGVLLLAGLVELSPFIAFASSIAWVRYAGFVAALVATGAAVAALWTNTRMISPALLWPLGWLLVAAGILRAAWLLEQRGGVQWRGTFYSRDELRSGQRFRMM
jgi:hypothetical protein